MRSHRTIMVPVMAPVDEGIAPLVMMLNTIPSCYTLASCEGHETAPGFVLFRGTNLPRLLIVLAPLLVGVATMRLTWGGGDAIDGEISLPKEHVEKATVIIRDFVKEEAR